VENRWKTFFGTAVAMSLSPIVESAITNRRRHGGMEDTMDYIKAIADMKALGMSDEAINYALSLAGNSAGKAGKAGKPEKTAEQRKAEKADYAAKLVALTKPEHDYVISHALEAKAQYVAGDKGAYTVKQRLFGFSSPFALKNIAKSGSTTPEYKAVIAKMLAADQAQPITANKRVAKKSA
jgi:hypothetical protein